MSEIAQNKSIHGHYFPANILELLSVAISTTCRNQSFASNHVVKFPNWLLENDVMVLDGFYGS